MKKIKISKKLILKKERIGELNKIVGGVEPTHTACSNCAVCYDTQAGMNCLVETQYPRCATDEPGGCVTDTCTC